MSQKKQQKPRATKRTQNHSKIDSTLTIKNIVPRTKIQEEVFEDWNDNYNLLLHGSAGSGKSFISMYLALKEILANKHEKVIIVRSTSQIRDVGFLPGSLSDKIAEFELPYKSICSELFSRGDAYELLKKKEVIEFLSTSFLRGTTFNDAIVIADEIQNYTEAEVQALMTRIGENSRVILCGDEEQVDLSGKKNDISWIKNFLDIVYAMESFSCHEFSFDDIVRSRFVKEYLLAKSTILK